MAADDRFSDGENRRGGRYGGGRDADRRSSPRRYGNDNSRPQRYDNRESSYERSEDDGPYGGYGRSDYSSNPAYRDYRDEPPKPKLRDSFQGVMLYGVAPVLAALQVRAGVHPLIHPSDCLPPSRGITPTHTAPRFEQEDVGVATGHTACLRTAPARTHVDVYTLVCAGSDRYVVLSMQGV